MRSDRSTSEDSLSSVDESEDLPREVNFERNVRYPRSSPSRFRHPKSKNFGAGGNDPSYRAENAERPFQRGRTWVSEESDKDYAMSTEHSACFSGNMIAGGNGRRYWSAAPFAPGELKNKRRSAVFRYFNGMGEDHNSEVPANIPQQFESGRPLYRFSTRYELATSFRDRHPTKVHEENVDLWSNDVIEAAHSLASLSRSYE